MYGAASPRGSASTGSAADSYGRPWWLMWESCSGLLTQGIALALLWWHFRHKPLEEVGCKDQQYVWFCETTQAHVDGFPLLAAAVCVAVAQRQFLRKRVYYGLLRRGVILDFRAVERQVDPLLVVLAWCLVCAVLHEVVFYTPKFKKKSDSMKVGIDDVVKVKVGGDDARKSGRWLEIDLDEDTSTFLLSYCAPCIVFLIFLYNAHQIEPSLVPLNSYYVEDPEEAKRMLKKAVVLDELEAAPAAATELKGQALDDVDTGYQALEQLAKSSPSAATSSWWTSLRSATSSQPASSQPPSWKEAIAARFSSLCSFRPWAHGLLSVPWPAHLLLQPSLADAASSTLLRTWRVMYSLCILFLSFVCVELGLISWDAWTVALSSRGNIGFFTGAVVLSLHLLLGLRVLLVTLLLVR